MRKVSLGELNAIVAGGTDGNGGGSGPIVVLLHGFGAPGADLVALARATPVEPSVRFVFPMGPIALEAGPAERVGRAWWMLDLAALQAAIRTKDYARFVKRDPEGLSLARKLLESALDALDAEIGPSSSVFVGGFSQGSMVSTDLVLRTDRRLSGLIIMSGALIAEDVWTERARARVGLPFFQSHGRADPILPYPLAEMLRDRLTTAGLVPRFHAFSGGHAITPEVLAEFGAFIRENRGESR